MFLRYLLVDSMGQFRLVDSLAVEDVWTGRRDSGVLGHPIGDELRLVTVVCNDENLAPHKCFFLRAKLKDGRITDESRFDAYDSMTEQSRGTYDILAEDHQLYGWPDDWYQQLAVALDVPVVELRKVGIGGPLLMADLWGFSIERILQYFEEGYQK
ncbi:MAG: hypothetical protein QF918_02850 [Pirellulaceae bacterium]|nr:hypothetical protein [Pirellulaceae bacterium]MDP6557266.1 hypothetical protein [Pirellulaceae bacterium]MDP6718121.1 hypothetical protein [Pirellulaceae bacterium]